MITYAQALSRARAAKSDWNEEERISKAIITWADSDWEYQTEVENEGMADAEFKAWVKEDAEELAAEDAAKEGTTCEEMTPGLRMTMKPTWSSNGNAALDANPAPAESQALKGACSRITSW